MEHVVHISYFGSVPLADIPVEELGIFEHAFHNDDFARVPLAGIPIEGRRDAYSLYNLSMFYKK